MNNNIDAEILEALEKMPESLKQELLHHAKSLQEHDKKNHSLTKKNFKNRRSGILEGTFVLPLPDDFDKPLEDFQEYMK